MPTETKIEQARRHVESGRVIVDRQRRLVEGGNAPPGAAELLEQFLQSQAIFEADLARFLEEQDRPGSDAENP